MLVSLAPIVADGVRENVPVAVESGARDRPADGRVAFEAMLGILVPKVERSVAASSAERAVDGVEGDGVDRVDIADVAVVRRRLTVALETEVRARVLIFNVLNGASALDAANGESRRVREAAHDARLPLER